MRGIVKFLIRWLIAWITGATTAGLLVLIAWLSGLFEVDNEAVILSFGILVLLIAFGAAWVAVDRVNRWLNKRG